MHTGVALVLYCDSKTSVCLTRIHMAGALEGVEKLSKIRFYFDDLTVTLRLKADASRGRGSKWKRISNENQHNVLR